MRQVTIFKTAIVRSVATVEVPDHWTDDDVERDIYASVGRGERWETLSEYDQFFEIKGENADATNRGGQTH